jgi:hypothetical protein
MGNKGIGHILSYNFSLNRSIVINRVCCEKIKISNPGRISACSCLFRTFYLLEIVKFKDAVFANELEDYASIRMTAVGRLSMNEWGGKRTPQFIIEDYELANAKYDF